MSILPESKEIVPNFEASRWLSIQALISSSEMEDLLATLSPIFIVRVGAVLPKEEALISKEAFCKTYASYVHTLSLGEKIDLKLYRPFFSTAWSAFLDHFLYYPVTPEKGIVKVVKPVIQLQVHCMGYSEIDDKFRPLVFGEENIAWGVQFSYPTLFHEATLGKVHKVDKSFPNTEVFHTLQKWIRKMTIPTPMLVKGKKIFLPIRIGKGCFSWIHRHPSLIQHGIHVDVP